MFRFRKYLGGHVPYLWSLLTLILFLTPHAVQAALPGLDLSIGGQVRLRATSYYGALPPSLPGSLPDPLLEQQQREIAAGADGIGVRQTTRLQIYILPSSGVSLKLGLHHVGWWGIDRYTSGTYGAPLFLSDPFRVDELFAALPFTAGTLYVGRQYLRFGDLGLLVATPIPEEIDPTPLAAVLWESNVSPVSAGSRANTRVTPSFTYAVVAGRLWLQPVEEEDGVQRLIAHDLIASRISKTFAITPAFMSAKTYPLRLGLNVLAHGVDRELGLGVDAHLPLGGRGHLNAEAAAVWPPGSPEWAVGFAGRFLWQWPGESRASTDTLHAGRSAPWELEVTAGAAQAGYSPVLSELHSSGGSLPFAPGEAGLQVRWRQTRGAVSGELTWERRIALPVPGTATASTAGGQSRAARQSVSLRLGWQPPIPGLTGQIGYDHWWTEASGYGRWLLEAAYAF